jgi:hypothetical protein
VSAALALQKALRARLVATPAVTALVPADNILDRHRLPAPSPAIVLGETQEIDDGAMFRGRTRVWHTIHVFRRELSLEGVTTIAAAVRKAVHAERLALEPGFHCIGAHVSSVRTMREAGDETSHAVVTVEAVIEETTP